MDMVRVVPRQRLVPMSLLLSWETFNEQLAVQAEEQASHQRQLQQLCDQLAREREASRADRLPRLEHLRGQLQGRKVPAALQEGRRLGAELARYELVVSYLETLLAIVESL